MEMKPGRELDALVAKPGEIYGQYDPAWIYIKTVEWVFIKLPVLAFVVLLISVASLKAVGVLQ